MTKSEEFFCRTSRFFSGILNVFQGKFAQLCGKITVFGYVVIFQTSPNITQATIARIPAFGRQILRQTFYV